MTVTVNPAVDISTSVGKIAPFSKLRCAQARQDPGGGGINVARVVTRLGGNATAIYPVGGATGILLHRLMDREGIASRVVEAAHETRQDFTVFEESTHRQYRFVMPGASLADSEWQQCIAAISREPPAPKFVVASGSLPPGVPDDFFAGIAYLGKTMAARVIVDTSGPALRAALAEGIYLMKPNLREFRELTGATDDDAALIAAGRKLVDKGSVELIALSLGQRGALLIAADRVLRAEGIAIDAASVVGAGDSFTGAFVCRLARDNDLEAALRDGVAAGTAAVMNPGTELCHAADVARLAGQVTVTREG